MKSTPKIGSSGELVFDVREEHTINFGDGMPRVLSTPRVIGFMELAAKEAIKPHLDDGESCVGVHVDVQHLAATPLGDRVVCRGRVIGTDGKTISFQIEASDSREVIARGIHKRRVVHIDSFKKRLERKQAGG